MDLPVNMNTQSKATTRINNLLSILKRAKTYFTVLVFSCILLAKRSKFFIDGRWHTWIDYDKFHALVQKFYNSDGNSEETFQIIIFLKKSCICLVKRERVLHFYRLLAAKS